MSESNGGVPPANGAPRAFRDWLPALAAALTLLGAITSVGSVISKVQDNDRRIAQIERDLRDSDAGNQKVIERLARIEGKLDASASQSGRQNP
jgi:hypothetical protein